MGYLELRFHYQLINSWLKYQLALPESLLLASQNTNGTYDVKTEWDKWQEIYHKGEGDAKREAKSNSSFLYLAQGSFFLGEVGNGALEDPGVTLCQPQNSAWGQCCLRHPLFLLFEFLIFCLPRGLPVQMNERSQFDPMQIWFFFSLPQHNSSHHLRSAAKKWFLKTSLWQRNQLKEISILPPSSAPHLSILLFFFSLSSPLLGKFCLRPSNTLCQKPALLRMGVLLRELRR